MKKLTLFVAGILVGAVPTAFAAATLFSDVDDSAWYYEAVASLEEKGIIQGYSDDTYKPSSYVNRAELAVTLDRLISYIEDGEVDPSVTAITISDSIPEESDGYSFGNEMYSDTYFLDKDTLFVNVGYGGGCEEHDFDLMWDGSFEDSENASLYLIHEGNDDACEAYANETLEFDLSSIKDAYSEEYDASNGTVFLYIYSDADEEDSFTVEYSF
ncbi:MAG: S-layer homology domain-containing protein [Candidatus Gracilibacteria bacterium]